MEGAQHSELFFSQYQAIAVKLKKRLMKKPNYKEAADAYGSLSKALDNNEWHQYAGLCREAMARCARISQNAPGEADAWAEAGRMFLKAESIYYSCNSATFEEGVHAAVQCFTSAVQAHKNAGCGSLAAKLSLEVAVRLRGLGKTGDAQLFFERAADLQEEMIEARLHCLEQVCSCQLAQRNFDGALKTLATLRTAARRNGASKALLQRIEITELLLLLLLKPSEFFMSDDHQQTLGQYRGNVCTYCGLVENADLLIHLQSLCLAVGSNDNAEVAASKEGLRSYLNLDQLLLVDLLERLVRESVTF